MIKFAVPLWSKLIIYLIIVIYRQFFSLFDVSQCDQRSYSVRENVSDLTWTDTDTRRPAMYRMKSPAEKAVGGKPMVCLVTRGGSEPITVNSNVRGDVQVMFMVQSYQVTFSLDKLLT